MLHKKILIPSGGGEEEKKPCSGCFQGRIKSGELRRTGDRPTDCVCVCHGWKGLCLRDSRPPNQPKAPLLCPRGWLNHLPTCFAVAWERTVLAHQKRALARSKTPPLPFDSTISPVNGNHPIRSQKRLLGTVCVCVWLCAPCVLFIVPTACGLVTRPKTRRRPPPLRRTLRG